MDHLTPQQRHKNMAAIHSKGTKPEITINYHLKQINESGEVHLSDAIRKIPILSEKWDEQGVTRDRSLTSKMSDVRSKM